MTIEGARRHAVTDLIGSVALLSRQEIAGWRTHGPIGDRVQTAFVDFDGDRYTILRDDDRAILVFTPLEWAAFVAAALSGEFTSEAGSAPHDQNARVEVGVNHGVVGIRDTKHRDLPAASRPVVVISSTTFASFLDGVRRESTAQAPRE